MKLEKDLQTAYSQDWESLGIVMNEINADIQTPFLLSVARGEGDDADESWWTEADIRVMFFGKEASQWKNEDTDAYLKQNNIEGVVLPVKSVGVQGDGRTYAQPFLLTTKNLSWKECEKYSTELVNRFKVINRVIWQVGTVSDEMPKLVAQYATKDKFDTLRKFDNICTEFLQENDLYEKIWQMPVVLTPLRVADKPCIVMRPVNSSEAMTANFAEIDQKLLNGLWGQFQADGAGSLWYDVTHKPPGTIEWE